MTGRPVGPESISTPPPITCGEWGAPEGERWSEPVHLDPADAKAVRLHEQDRILQVRPVSSPRDADWSDAPLFSQVQPDGRVQIAGTDHVGLLLLPSGRRVHIRPKIGGLALLDWLAYLGESPPVNGWLRDSLHPLCEGGPFEPAVAGLFLAELESLTRLHFRKQYVAARNDSATVRGKVLTSALVRRYHRLPALPQVSPARTWDTPPHALLTAALDSVALLTECPRPPAGLADAWACVGRAAPHDLPRLLHECRTAAPPPGYGPALQMASLVLQGCSPLTPEAGRRRTSPGPSFLLSVAGVWERALRRMCGELSAGTGWKPAPDAQRTRRWHDGARARRVASVSPRDDAPRWMTADALLESAADAGRRWVLDAKYKRGFGEEDRADRFQAAAYAVAFDAGRGSLVYPTAEGQGNGDSGGVSSRRRLLLAGEVAGRAVTIDSIELPMAAGPGACRAALAKVMAGEWEGVVR